MNANNHDSGFGYYAKQVALDLDITTSTLRRWSISLEKEGYTFERNDKDQRIYYERDFKVIREIKYHLANSVNMEDAIRLGISKVNHNQIKHQTPSVHETELRLSKCELQAIVHEEVKKAVEAEREAMFHAFERRLNDVIEMRDKETVKFLKDSMEHQKQLAATIEDGKKKGLFARLFGK